MNKLTEREDHIYCLKQISELLREQAQNVSTKISTKTLKSYVEKLLSIIGEYREINWFEEIEEAE